MERNPEFKELLGDPSFLAEIKEARKFISSGPSSEESRIIVLVA